LVLALKKATFVLPLVLFLSLIFSFSIPEVNASPDIYLKDSPVSNVVMNPGRLMDFIAPTKVTPSTLSTQSGVEYYWYSPLYYDMIPGPKGHSFHLYYTATMTTTVTVTVCLPVESDGGGNPFVASNKTITLDATVEVKHITIPDVIVIPEIQLHGERIQLSIRSEYPITLYYDSIETPCMLNVVPPPQTDWSLSNPSVVPSSPKAEDPVTFKASLQSLSTSQPYPQSVKVVIYLDGAPISGGSLNYPGPTGIPMIVSSTPPWTATEGTHTLLFIVDPAPHAYNDPNTANNKLSLTFSVAPKPEPFDFTMTTTPSSHTIKAGGTVTYSVIANHISGTPSTVKLSISGLPAKATSTFTPDHGESTFASNLIIETTADTNPGSYTLTITGKSGAISKTVTVTLAIEPVEEPDFTVSATPSSHTIQPTQQITFKVTVTGKGDFKSAVDLAVTGLSTGIQARFDPTTGKPDYTSILTLTVTENTIPGTYTLTIYASGGGKTKSTILTLIVEEAPSTPLTVTESPPQSSASTMITHTEIPQEIKQLLENSSLLIILVLMIIIILLLLVLVFHRKQK
jgi:hypothetical protein